MFWNEDAIRLGHWKNAGLTSGGQERGQLSCSKGGSSKRPSADCSVPHSPRESVRGTLVLPPSLLRAGPGCRLAGYRAPSIHPLAIQHVHAACAWSDS